MLPMQVLAEFLNVCRRKSVLSAERAAFRVSGHANVFQIPHTTVYDLIAGAAIAERYRLSYFDALLSVPSAVALARPFF